MKDSHHLPSPSSTRLIRNSLQALYQTNELQDLFHKADYSWLRNHESHFFSDSYLTRLPSLWAHHTLAYNITLALAKHCSTALYKVTTFSHRLTTAPFTCTLLPVRPSGNIAPSVFDTSDPNTRSLQ